MLEPGRLVDTLNKIDDRWDTARTERTLSALQQRRQGSHRRPLLLAAGALCALACLLWGLRPVTAPPRPAAVAASVSATPSLLMQLADGSAVTLRDAQTRLVVDEVSNARMVLRMQGGQAQFDVVHREQRKFEVHCGDVTVAVLGTAFELERQDARTRVAVSRGRVAVSWPGGRTELTAGEAGWFPRAEPHPPAAQSRQDSPDTLRHAKRAARRASAPVLQSHNTWREPAERGDFDHAYELLAQAPQPVADDVQELLLAADTARLSGHPEAALPFLKRVITQHAEDSRAPLAAFTLGGVLMQQLGQPREAEASYARARQLSLNSSLAEDALARQVEAAHRAGDAARARSLAREYLATYPRGRRVHAVQRFGGL